MATQHTTQPLRTLQCNAMRCPAATCLFAQPAALSHLLSTRTQHSCCIHLSAHIIVRASVALYYVHVCMYCLFGPIQPVVLYCTVLCCAVRRYKDFEIYNDTPTLPTDRTILAPSSSYGWMDIRDMRRKSNPSPLGHLLCDGRIVFVS